MTKLGQLNMTPAELRERRKKHRFSIVELSELTGRRYQVPDEGDEGTGPCGGRSLRGRAKTIDISRCFRHHATNVGAVPEIRISGTASLFYSTITLCHTKNAEK